MLEVIVKIFNDPDIRVNLDFEPGRIQWFNSALIRHRRTSYMNYSNDPENKLDWLTFWLRKNGVLGHLG